MSRWEHGAETCKNARGTGESGWEERKRADDAVRPAVQATWRSVRRMVRLVGKRTMAVVHSRVGRRCAQRKRLMGTRSMQSSGSGLSARIRRLSRMDLGLNTDIVQSQVKRQ